jgi:hypothetical protein
VVAGIISSSEPHVTMYSRIGEPPSSGGGLQNIVIVVSVTVYPVNDGVPGADMIYIYYSKVFL